MISGVPRKHESPLGDCLAVVRRRPMRAGGHPSRVGLLLLGLISMLVFASSALGSTGTVHPGWGERGSSSHHASGCTGHGGDGKVPPVAPPVVPSPPVGRGGSESGSEGGSGGGASTETTTSKVAAPAVAVAVPVAAPSVTAPPPAAPKSTLKQPVRKSTLKRPARKAAKKRAKKHHSRAGGASNERALARSALPNKRAAFTG
jgi:hypothetical protein